MLGAGLNKHGQLALPIPRVDAFTNITPPSPIIDGNPVSSCLCVMAACGSNHSVALYACTPMRQVGDLGGGIQTTISRVYAFGSNTFGQVAASSSTASMFRSMREVTEVSDADAWNMKKIIGVAAGGDQSFTIGCSQVSTDNVYSLRKQFSTLASKAVTPLDATSLLQLLNKSTSPSSNSSTSSESQNSALTTTTPYSDPRVVELALSTVCEIFSSPSLLSGSFLSAHKDIPADITGTGHGGGDVLSLDVVGLENCYIKLILSSTPLLLP